MPTYVYKCNKCSNTFDKVEKFGSSSTIKCIYCNKKTATRQFSPPTVLYKGDGWYSKPNKGD